MADPLPDHRKAIGDRLLRLLAVKPTVCWTFERRRPCFVEIRDVLAYVTDPENSGVEIRAGFKGPKDSAFRRYARGRSRANLFRRVTRVIFTREDPK